MRWTDAPKCINIIRRADPDKPAYLFYGGQTKGSALKRCYTDLQYRPSSLFNRWEATARQAGRRTGGCWTVYTVGSAIAVDDSFASRLDWQAAEWGLVDSILPIGLNSQPGCFHHFPRSLGLPLTFLVTAEVRKATGMEMTASSAVAAPRVMLDKVFGFAHRDMAQTLTRLPSDSRGAVMTATAIASSRCDLCNNARLDDGHCPSIFIAAGVPEAEHGTDDPEQHWYSVRAGRSPTLSRKLREIALGIESAVVRWSKETQIVLQGQIFDCRSTVLVHRSYWLRSAISPECLLVDARPYVIRSHSAHVSTRDVRESDDRSRASLSMGSWLISGVTDPLPSYEISTKGKLHATL